jgi:hypothetical protein
VVLFEHTATPQGRLRVFGRQASLYKCRKTAQTSACTNCYGFHRGKCSRRPKCGNCSLPAHPDSQCTQRPRCLNCRGPHPSTEPTCPARPKAIQGVIRRPNKAQMRAIKALGNRAWAEAQAAAQTEAQATATTTVSGIPAPGATTAGNLALGASASASPSASTSETQASRPTPSSTL